MARWFIIIHPLTHLLNRSVTCSLKPLNLEAYLDVEGDVEEEDVFAEVHYSTV